MRHQKPTEYLRELIGIDPADLYPNRGPEGVPAELHEQRFDSLQKETELPITVRCLPRSEFRDVSIERLLGDARRLSSIECPTFLKPIDWGITSEFLFVVNYRATGWPLSDMLRLGQGPTSRLKRALSVTCDILLAVQKIHESGCVARNICLSNLYLGHEHATLICPGPENYRDHANAGDKKALDYANFASPELSGSIQHEIGPASDLYSLGVLLFTLLTGREPFQGDSVGAILYQHITVDPQFLLADQEIPRVLAEVIGRLLKKDPRARYQSARAVLNDLQQIQMLVNEGRSIDGFVIGRDDVRNSIVEPSFVGRKREIAALSEAFEEAAKGSSISLSIAAPCGMGKTRLVEEVLQSLGKNSVMVYRSAVPIRSREIALTPLLRIVEQLLEHVRTYDDLRRRLSRELLDVRQEVSTVFPDLAQAMGWPVFSQTTLDETSKGQIDTAFARVLSSLGDAERPALVWLDDCHHLDQQILGILGRLAATPGNHCLFVFTLRNDDHADRAFHSRVFPSKKLVLEELENSEVKSMLESMAGHLPDSAIDAIVKLAGGSPYMASAILQGLIETGALKFEFNSWKADPKKLASVQASQNAAETLVSRLNEVPPTIQKVLSTGAIVGKEFDEQMVAELSRLPVSKVEECLKWSRQQRIVWLMSNGKYLFVHDKIKDALLSRMSPSFRKESHLAYAQYLDKVDPENAPELAYHYHLADENERALTPALKAAAQAQRLQSFDRAEDFLRIAVCGLARADKLIQHNVYSQLANVLMLVGKYDESESWLKKSQDTAISSQEHADIEMKLGELAFKRGDKEQADHRFSAALRELGYSVPQNPAALWRMLIWEIVVQTLHSLLPRLLVGRKKSAPPASKRLVWRLHSRIGHAFWFSRGKLYTLWAHLRHMNMAEKYSATIELAQAYSEHAPAMSLIPWFQRGVKYVKRSLDIREFLNDEWGQGQSRNFYSILLYSSSQYTSCIEQAASAETILTRTGDYWEVNIARYQHAASLYRLGDLKGALDLARRTYDSALAIGDYQSTGNIIDVWARAALGDIPEEVVLAESKRDFHDPQGRCQVLLGHGIFLFFKGEFLAAAEKFRSAIEIARRSGIVHAYVIPNFPWLATALRRQLETAPPRSPGKLQQMQREFLSVAQRAVRASRRFQNDLPHALRELAAAQIMFGQTRKAKATLQRSMQIAQKQQAHYEYALTQEMFGLLGADFGWSGSDAALQTASQSIRDMRKGVQRVDTSESMSMLDRFDTLLMAGRQIISVNLPQEILNQTVGAAKRLLRGQRTIVIEKKESNDGYYWHSTEHNAVIDVGLVEEATAKQKTVVRDFERYNPLDQTAKRHGTYLCSPIIVHGQVVACLYVANEFLSGLFGENEIRIADYVTTTAGSALEKSDGFRQLEKLNLSLEKIVQERTATVEARSRELEQTARELMATQSKLELARDEAQTANAAKSEFLARMSHEIRTPISAIMGFTELMLRGIVSDPIQRTQKLETIYTNSTHLLQLINDLLDLSKIEADKMLVESIDCNPLRILFEVVSSLQVRAEQKSISLTMKFDGHVPKRICSDPTRLRQVLINVIGNAIKFTSVGGVDVNLRLVDGFEPPDSSGTERKYLEFEIVDSGIGMTPEQLSKIFDPFSQADSTVTRKFGGTGLGLSISKQLAEALGGSISVSSVVNVGSSFTIRVNPGVLTPNDLVSPDTAMESVSSVSERRFLKANLEGLNVLIVDDGETNRELLKLMLSDAGAIVECRCNGQEGVDAIENGMDCDVVLMDMQMPVLDGYSAAKLLRANGFKKPIIALTANTMVGDEEKCRECGCSDYLSKPIDINKLLLKLSELLGVSTKTLSLTECLQRAKIAPAPIPPSEKVISVPAPKNFAPWELELPEDEVFRSFATDFVHEVTGQLDSIRAFLNQQEFGEVASKAHWIKGTGGTVGLPRLTTIAANLETATKARDLESMRQFLDELSQFVGLDTNR